MSSAPRIPKIFFLKLISLNIIKLFEQTGGVEWGQNEILGFVNERLRSKWES